MPRSAITFKLPSLMGELDAKPEIYGAIADLLADEIVPFDASHWALAREAYRDFGRGSGHPARLNMGDCYAYALHRATGDPLLYIGDDFAGAGVPRATP